jgi:hypothetical protein
VLDWLAAGGEGRWRTRTVAVSRAVRRRARHVGSGQRELVVALSAYGLYTIIRGLRGGSLAEGQANAARVADLEKRLGIWWEPGMQSFFTRHNLAMPFWNALYPVSQVVVLPLTLFLVFRYRRRAYAFVRNLAILSWTGGVVWYALQPVAPPRLAGQGFIDTVSSQTFLQLDSSFVRAFYNPVAAMPSLHVGMAPVVAWALWRLAPWTWARWLGVAYPFLVTIAVIVTGNHYVLDVAGGLAVVLPAALVARILTGRPLPPPPLPLTLPIGRTPAIGDARTTG